MRITWKIVAAALLLFIIAVPAVLAATSCTDGCSCMAPEDAKNKGYSYCQGKETPCGTDNLGRKLYCFSIVSMTSVITPAILYQTPAATSCVQGCECMAESDAKVKFGGLYQRCSDTVCGYMQSASVAGTSNAANIVMPKYCFKKLEQETTVSATPATACPAGCACLNDADAKAKFNGAFERCSNTACGYDQTSVSVSTRYCYRTVLSTTTMGGTVPVVSQGCPDGCGCMSDEEGQKIGYSYCNGVQKICGYQSWTGTTASTSGQRPLYCYGKGTLSTCGGGCECMSEATAVKKFGTYQFCSNTICGYEKSATTGTISMTSNVPVASAVISQYCIMKAGVPVNVTGCSYNKEKQACTGTCTANTGCVMVGTEKNSATGEETPICKCQPGSCSFDYSLDTCTGSCPLTGQACQVNTMSKDPLTGKTLFAECHCKAGGTAVVATPQVAGVGNATGAGASVTAIKPCGCDPATNICTGTCDGNGVCTPAKTTTDAAGKVLCVDCQCTTGCSYVQATNTCTGSCIGGGVCQLVTAKDPVTGVEKTGCSCGNAVTGATPVPVPVYTSAVADPFTNLGNIFRSFFGWK
ncbi:MAG: hypothetical protein Q7U51_03970 [Methanoregula sp.]|nr:hypothetical protein [Methanoregula sp.]